MFKSGNLKSFSSQNILTLLLEHISEGFAILDAQGNTLHLNSQGRKILRVQDHGEPSLVDPSWKTVTSEKIPLSLESHPISIALRTGQAQTAQHLGIEVQQEQKWIELNAFPLKAQDSEQLIGVAVTFQDETDKVLSQLRIRQEDETLRILSENLPGMVHELEISPDGNIRTTYASEGSKLLYEVTPEQIVSGNLIVMQMIDPEFRASFREMLQHGINFPDEPHRTWTGRFTMPSGTKKWISVRFNVRKLPNGFIRFHSLHLDVSERVRLESELVNSAKMSALGMMAAGVAHEINNPLAIIAGRSQELSSLIERGDINPAKMQKISESIDRTTHRIAKIIRALRSFARDAQNDPMESVPVKTLIEDVLSLCQSRFINQGIELQCTPIPSEWTLFCRPTQISQLLINLLNNAFDAVEHSSEKKVWLQAQKVGPCLEFRVIDSGPGIPEVDRQKIMQPFYTTKQVDRGTGLGLSIVEGLAKAHHGSVWLDEKSSNTCFVVRLPLAAEPTVSHQSEHPCT